MSISKMLAAAGALALAPALASAVVVSPGIDVDGDGDTLTMNNPTFAEIITADGDIQNLSISFTYTGPVSDIGAFTFGVGDSVDFDDADMNFQPVGGVLPGGLQEGIGTITGLSLSDGQSIFALFDSNGSLDSMQTADVGFTVTSANRIPLPAAAWFLIGGLGGLGLIGYRKKAA